MALSLFMQSKTNFDIVKDDIAHNLGKYVSHITLHLKQLDSEHYQLDNGVPPCQFSSFVLNVNNIWTFNKQTYEFDDSLHTFRIRENNIIVGDLLIHLFNGTNLTGFTIKPTIIDGKQQAQLTISSIYEQNIDQTMVIKLQFDKSKRIQCIEFPTIDISKHPTLKNIILKEVLCGYENAHTKNTLELMNKLSYDLIVQQSLKDTKT